MSTYKPCAMIIGTDAYGNHRQCYIYVTKYDRLVSPRTELSCSIIDMFVLDTLSQFHVSPNNPKCMLAHWWPCWFQQGALLWSLCIIYLTSSCVNPKGQSSSHAWFETPAHHRTSRSSGYSPCQRHRVHTVWDWDMPHVSTGIPRNTVGLPQECLWPQPQGTLTMRESFISG